MHSRMERGEGRGLSAPARSLHRSPRRAPSSVSTWPTVFPDAQSDTLIQRKPACACGGSCPQYRCAGSQLPAGLRVSSPGDRLEREADETADQLVQQYSGRSILGLAGQVNLHTDRAAANAADSLDARAFTHGHDIYFNRGEFDPGSGRGQRLLAHELTHVAQQRRLGSGTTLVQRAPKDEGKAADLPRVTTLLPWRAGTTIYMDLLVDTFTGQVTEHNAEEDRVGITVNLPVKLELGLLASEAGATAQSVSMTPYVKVKDQYLKLPVPADKLPKLIVTVDAKGRISINGLKLKKSATGVALRKHIKEEVLGLKIDKEITAGTLEGMTTSPSTDKEGYLTTSGGKITSLKELLPFFLGSEITLDVLGKKQKFVINFGKGGKGLALSATIPLALVVKRVKNKVLADVSLFSFPIKENVELPIKKEGEAVQLTLPGVGTSVKLVPGKKALKILKGVQVGGISTSKAETFPGTPPWEPKPVVGPAQRSLFGLPTLMPLGGMRFASKNRFLMRSVMTDLMSSRSRIFSILPSDWQKPLLKAGSGIDSASKKFEADFSKLMLDAVMRYASLTTGLEFNGSTDGKKAWIAPSVGADVRVPLENLKLYFFLGAGLPVSLHNIGTRKKDVLNLGFYGDLAISGKEETWSTALRLQAATGGAPSSAFLMFSAPFDETKWFR